VSTSIIFAGLGITTANSTIATDVVSQPILGDGSLHRASGQHTLYAKATNLTANITIEGTIGIDTTGPWLIVPLTNTLTGNVTTELNYSNISGTECYSITGQFTFLRARVQDYSTGILDNLSIMI